MTPNRSNLLRDVSAAIIASGYAVPPQPCRRHVARRSQIEVLAHDPRLTSTGGRSNFVRYVMDTYGVSNSNARQMLHQARKIRKSRNA